MPELPQGTVTFAFTDIEGSTSLLKALGDEYAVVLSEHRQIVREVFGSHGGVEIDTQGDAFFYAFGRARDAVAAAARVQQAHATHAWPQGASVLVRIGLHTGEPTFTTEGYVGLDVVHAARLCGACRGGQVLLSQVTKALAGSNLPDGVEVYPVGERELKDMDEPEVVYELGIVGVTPKTPTAATAATASAAPMAEPADAVMEASPSTVETAPTQGRPVTAQFDDWTAKLEAAIEQRMRDSVAKSLDRPGADVPPEGREEIERGMDAVAAGMAGFSKRLSSQLAALFDEIRVENSEPKDE